MTTHQEIIANEIKKIIDIQVELARDHDHYSCGCTSADIVQSCDQKKFKCSAKIKRLVQLAIHIGEWTASARSLTSTALPINSESLELFQELFG